MSDELNFYEWASRHWPRQRFTVQLDPQLEPWQGGEPLERHPRVEGEGLPG